MVTSKPAPSATLATSTTFSADLANATSVVPTPSPTAAPHRSNAGAIAGGVVGGIAGLAFVGLFIFIIRRQRKRNLRVDHIRDKPQLHSDDLKPDRKGMEGSKASRDMLEKQGKIAEMPANGEMELKSKKLEEMPSNEPTGYEVETTENEMRALDPLARSSEGTTLVSSKKSEEQSATV